MATYNGADLVTVQLDSLRLQDVAPNLVLIHDDASSDATANVVADYIARYRLTHWQLTVHNVNLGWRATFRRLWGEALAAGADVVLFADQDDAWDAAKVRRQLDVLAAHPDIEVLSCDYESVNVLTGAASSSRGLLDFPDADAQLSYYPARHSDWPVRLGWVLAVRAGLLAELAEVWREDLRISHDVLLTNLAGFLGTGANLNEVLGRHIVHGTNASKAVTTAATRNEHLLDLLAQDQRYALMVAVLTARGSSRLADVRAVAAFRHERRLVAQSGRVTAAAWFVLRNWRRYASTRARARDVYFALRTH
jgi:glycosyltransferase involved in cell wall biosynthesis